MALELVQGTKQNVNVTVREATGAVTTLDGTSPSFDIYAVDPDTDEDITTRKFKNSVSASNSGMMVQCLVDTTSSERITQPFVLATLAPPVLPLVVASGTNDKFSLLFTNDFNTKEDPGHLQLDYTIPAGTYNTITDIVNLFEGGTIHDQDGHPTYWYFDMSDGGGGKLLATADGWYEEFNGTVFKTGATHDVLAGLGIANNQAFEGGVGGDVEWPMGKYRMYIRFTIGSEVPILGPVEFLVV